MGSVRLKINECLATEWGFGEEGGTPSETWPFDLKYWGEVEGWELYLFVEAGTPRYAGYADDVGVISATVSDMTLADLTAEFRGGDWISEHLPVELNDSDTESDDSIPPYSERLAAIEALGREAVGSPVEVVRGYWLEATGGYLGLVRQPREREALVVGTGLPPLHVSFPKATPERRMALALGRHLAAADSEAESA